MFTVYLKFKFNWAPVFLSAQSSNPTAELPDSTAMLEMVRVPQGERDKKSQSAPLFLVPQGPSSFLISTLAHPDLSCLHPTGSFHCSQLLWPRRRTSAFAP